MRHRSLSVADIPRKTRELFWDHVLIVDDENSCWPWLGAEFRKGYGNFAIPGFGNIGAHIVAFLLDQNTQVVELQPKDCILHQCDNPPCCRPKHLFKGTRRDNTQDMIAKGRDRFKENIKYTIGHQPKGEAASKAKLTETEVRAIKCARATGVSQKTLALRYGVRKQSIQAIDHGRSWKHVL